MTIRILRHTPKGRAADERISRSRPFLHHSGAPRYLRNPTVGELADVALPAVTGLLFRTFSGGLIGYRQANSVRLIRAEDAEGFPRS